MSKLDGGQMASLCPGRTVGVRGGREEAGKRALSHAAQGSESRRVTELTGVWIGRSRGNGWNLSHGCEGAPHVYA